MQNVRPWLYLRYVSSLDRRSDGSVGRWEDRQTDRQTDSGIIIITDYTAYYVAATNNSLLEVSFGNGSITAYTAFVMATNSSLFTQQVVLYGGGGGADFLHASAGKTFIRRSTFVGHLV